MNREALEAPFPPELVKTRKGAFGQTLSYIEGVEYVRRLNNVFEAAWSYEVVSHQILFDSEVVVLGKLTADGVTKQAFGGSQITRTKESNQVVSIADDLKAAATDSLKKCCSLFGIGLHLYADENGRAASRNNANNQARPQTKGHNGQSNGNDRLSQRQLSAIWSLARKAGYSSDEIRQRCIESFNKSVEQLSKTDASSLIGDLSDELGDSAYNGSKS